MQYVYIRGSTRKSHNTHMHAHTFKLTNYSIYNNNFLYSHPLLQKCYRLGPTHTRKQESCKVEINPIRKTPPIEPAEPVNVADDDNDDV